jgi:hypothetical protein
MQAPRAFRAVLEAFEQDLQRFVELLAAGVTLFFVLADRPF